MESGFSTVIFELMVSSDFGTVKLMKAVDFLSGSGYHYRIPRGQSSDMASIPNACWGAPLFLIPTGWYSLPAIGHDAAFRNTLLVVEDDGTTRLANLTAAESNNLFLEMMQAIKPHPTVFEKLQMDAIYKGVSLFGWHAYNENRA